MNRKKRDILFLTITITLANLNRFLPRCMECRHGLAMRILSVCQTRALWHNRRKSVQIFIPYERSFSLVFWEEEWLLGDDAFYPNFGSTGPRWNEIADFEPIIACSAVIPSEKSSVNTNRKSATHFPISLRWSSYVAPKSPKVGLKNTKRPFFL